MAACDATACPNAGVVIWKRRSATDPTATYSVYACVSHAITLDLASHVHAPTCPGPNAPTLPQCGCTVEPIDTSIQPSGGEPLPPGW